jgi:hypothetical protein
MPVLPAAISNVWSNDDFVANIVMEYEADTVLTKIDDYAKANLNAKSGAILSVSHDGNGTVMIGLG